MLKETGLCVLFGNCCCSDNMKSMAYKTKLGYNSRKCVSVCTMVGLFTTHITEGQGLLEGYTRRGFLHEMHKATGLRKAILK